MENRISVTFNRISGTAVFHMKDGSTKEMKMSPDEWNRLLSGDINENLNKILNE